MLNERPVAASRRNLTKTVCLAGPITSIVTSNRAPRATPLQWTTFGTFTGRSSDDVDSAGTSSASGSGGASITRDRRAP
eukprot:2125971-Prymnesium_polylepis.1